MEHLPIYLVEEALLGVPIDYSWMYFLEVFWLDGVNC